MNMNNNCKPSPYLVDEGDFADTGLLVGGNALGSSFDFIGEVVIEQVPFLDIAFQFFDNLNDSIIIIIIIIVIIIIIINFNNNNHTNRLPLTPRASIRSCASKNLPNRPRICTLNETLSILASMSATPRKA